MTLTSIKKNQTFIDLEDGLQWKKLKTWDIKAHLVQASKKINVRAVKESLAFTPAIEFKLLVDPTRL